MKRVYLCLFLLCFSSIVALSQDRVDITSFEEGLDWTWTNGSVLGSFIEPPDPSIASPVDGDNVLVVLYDNGGSEWQHGNFNFPIGSVDLTGMREIRMSVLFTEGSTGDLGIRLDLPGGNILGFAYPQDEDGNDIVGEWVELSFQIDRLLSASGISDISYFQGFIVPTPGDAFGEVWFDNIYAVRPESVPVVEEIQIYDFEESDPVTTFAKGWEPQDGLDAALGAGETDPVTGNNYMIFFAGGGYSQNVKTVNALNDFDRWDEVVEILFDIRIVDTVPGGWLQSRLHIVSGVEGNDDATVETQTKEIGYSDTASSDSWKTMLYEVDMSDHLANINDPNGWLEIRVSTNNDASAVDHPIFLDNFRVSVPEGSGSAVSDWSVQ